MKTRELSDRSRLAVIGTIIPVLIGLKFVSVRREWVAGRPVSGVPWLASWWDAVIRAVDDPLFWAVVSGGVVGLFVTSAAGYVRGDAIAIGRASGGGRRFTLLTAVAVIASGFACVIAPTDIPASRMTGDAWSHWLPLLERGLCAVGVGVAVGFWASGRACLDALLVQLRAETTAEEAAADLVGVSFLFSAVLAGPMTSAVAFVVWRTSDTISRTVPPSAPPLWRTLALGVGVIGLTSLPGILLHCDVSRRLRGLLRFRPHWRNLCGYFTVAFLFGIPLKLTLVKAALHDTAGKARGE